MCLRDRFRAPERVYVANQSSASVSVIDVASGDVIHTVDVTELGFDANSRPHHTAADPDGEHWYVSLIGGGNVLRFNSNFELVGQAPFETPDCWRSTRPRTCSTSGAR